MNVKNCRRCGKIFNYAVGPYICPACKEALEKKFQEVKEFIRENGKATVQEVCEACNVEPTQLRQWIREERLQFSDDSPIKVACEGCGAMIGSGRFCDKCRANLANGFGSTIQKPEAEGHHEFGRSNESHGMRFLK